MSLRVYSRSGYDAARAPSTGAASESDSYMGRLVKLVPAEVIAAYPVIKNAAPEATPWALPLAAWMLLVIVVILRWHATTIPGKGPQWTAITLSAISFIIWIYVMDGRFGIEGTAIAMLNVGGGADQSKALSFLGSLALVAWTIVVPAIYKGDES